MDTILVDQLALPKSKVKVNHLDLKAKLPRHKPGEKFLKGPIPLNWLCAAAQLPGKSIHVANVIWFLAGMTNSATLKLSNSVLNDFGVTKDSKYRALNWLVGAGLIEMQGGNGKSPIITILAAPDLQDSNENTRP